MHNIDAVLAFTELTLGPELSDKYAEDYIRGNLGDSGDLGYVDINSLISVLLRILSAASPYLRDP